MSRWSQKVLDLFVLAYPSRLRAEYGGELGRTIRALAGRNEYRGTYGRHRLWGFLVIDVVTSVAREHVARLPHRSVPRYRRADKAAAPPYGDATLAALLVLALYVATLAPSVAFWDSGEYLTAAHILGIPHPPGNPLFVLLAHGWEKLLAPFGLSAAVSLNLFSAVLSAGAHFFWYLVAYRFSLTFAGGPRLARVSAALCVLLSATAFTVWNQSNVNEKVYTLSLFSVALISWLTLRWHDTGGSSRRLLMIAFLVALTSTNHLMGVLVLPAVVLYVVWDNARVLRNARLWAGLLLVSALGLTPHFFLPLRSAQRPILNEGEPNCASPGQAAASIYSFGRTGCPALSSSLRREQYGKPPITLDPTVYPRNEVSRDARLFGHQVANYAQYFNWQWARGFAGPSSFAAVGVLLTALFLLFGCLGALRHWQRDRAGAAYLGVLFLTLSLGLVVYLNFKYGFAQARGAFPDPEMHEVRERDYFFLISFSVWALWAGMGLTLFWQSLTRVLKLRVQHAQLLTAPVLAIAIVPLGANWHWASRAQDYSARDWAYNVLMSVGPYGVLFTNGDNDTFPLWYLQEVEGIRRDVTVAVTSYLNTPWYARQVRDLSGPCARGQHAQDAPTRIVCQRPFSPAQLPVALRQAEPPAPEDSILPLSDEQISQISASYFVVDDPITFQAAGIQSNIAQGTEMLPADTFVAAIVQASLGKRPVHFMTPSPVVQKLGLSPHAVRTGLTFRLHDGRADGSAELVPLPRSELTPVLGETLDLHASTTLLKHVFEQRGRVLDTTRPWADQATSNILLQYAWLNYAMAQAHAERSEPAIAQQYARTGEWWQRRSE